MRRHRHVTNQQASTNPAANLHRHLTVAFANAADRARLVQVIGGEPGSRLVAADELLPIVEDLAAERASGRAALRACLDTVAARTMHDCDTANQELEALLARRRALLEGADWATQVHAGLASRLAAVETAREVLDDRRAEQRAAQAELDKVMEQRKAVAVAIEEADGQLAEMADLGMDEGGLRRELEAAGQAVRVARAVHEGAVARLAELQLERAALAPDPIGPDGLDPAAILAVRDALAGLELGTRSGAVDPRAVSLVSALEELTADLDRLGGLRLDALQEELVVARCRAEEASAHLAELDAAKAAAITPEQRAAVDAAHTAVQEATEQLDNRNSSGARKRLARAQEAERALLDEHGFGSYLEVVLTGGRAGTADPARALAEREVFDATRARDALERQAQVTPELAHLLSERTRLLHLAAEVLGVDPGERALVLLRSHQPVGTGLQIHLVDALDAVGVHPVGVALDQAARSFLEAHPIPEPADPEAQALRDARSAALTIEIDAAQAEVDRTDEALQMAERSVGTLESELSERSDADKQRMERFTAAEQLRTQISAVAGTLRRAEAGSRQKAEEADGLVAAAEATLDQAAAELSGLAERGRLLVDQLPEDRRPEGEPLHNLEVLTGRLREQAEALTATIEQTEATARTVTTQMEAALRARRLSGSGEGPQAEDYVEVLSGLFDGAPGVSLFVLDEPFGDPGEHALLAALEAVRHAAASRQIVLLTDDPDVIGWAIDLPAQAASADPADALLARLVAPDDETFNSTLQSVDITSTMPDSDPEPAQTARRWAGQR